ncbi:Ribose 5-phosphate isomerase [Trachipleistophora hominis]|uniref:Ribose-5-phosphate isomerase n=1 Tax=Trachipleistophora hominis TaxID=72359 RepID=L7JYY0_TRAHO|nr:Ribose 5-phosphate isomerase [Trachipleistophora hominis]
MENIFDKYITDQKTIGIGTGNTIKTFISNIKTHNEKYFVPSSLQSFFLLKANNFRTQELQATETVDIYFDSADYFDNDNNLIKGRGGALLNEKLLMSMSKHNVILVDDKKFKSDFDDLFIPLEIIRSSLAHVKDVLRKHDIDFCVREYIGKIGPVITEHGNLIVDVKYDLKFLKSCKNIVGVVEHGLFLNDDFCVEIERV